MTQVRHFRVSVFCTYFRSFRFSVSFPPPSTQGIPMRSLDGGDEQGIRTETRFGTVVSPSLSSLISNAPSDTIPSNSFSSTFDLQPPSSTASPDPFSFTTESSQTETHATGSNIAVPSQIQSSENQTPRHRPSRVAIMGIAVGLIILFALMAVVVFLLRRARAKRIAALSDFVIDTEAALPGPFKQQAMIQTREIGAGSANLVRFDLPSMAHDTESSPSLVRRMAQLEHQAREMQGEIQALRSQSSSPSLNSVDKSEVRSRFNNSDCRQVNVAQKEKLDSLAMRAKGLQTVRHVDAGEDVPPGYDFAMARLP
ncbi:hypothetical protein R3P38DRAFT_3122895 [Favolaschia claudopus]|uniref:Uncharacterized protein n=1 Tax=Favolaschia claudopus TaxID=2862362 RepID=A0AAV9ZCF8_9AGAR